MSEIHLNALTINSLDSKNESIHASTYIFFSSVPVALINDQEIVYRYLRPFVLDALVGEGDSYTFTIVCNNFSIENLPNLNMPYVDVQALRENRKY